MTLRWVLLAFLAGLLVGELAHEEQQQLPVRVDCAPTGERV